MERQYHSTGLSDEAPVTKSSHKRELQGELSKCA